MLSQTASQQKAGHPAALFMAVSIPWTGLLDWNTGLTFDLKIVHTRLNLASWMCHFKCTSAK